MVDPNSGQGVYGPVSAQCQRHVIDLLSGFAITTRFPAIHSGLLRSVTLFNDILASFDAALVDDPESTWSFVFYSQGGEGRLLLLPEAPTPSRLRRLRAEADAALILGSLWADTAGKGLLFEVDVARGPALAALEASLKSLGRAFQIRQDDVEEEEEEAPHPYPVLRRLLAGLALASEPWPFVYVPAEPGK